MEWYEKVSIKAVDFVEKQLPDVTSDERDRIKYGVEAFLVNLGQLPILFLIAYLFNVIKSFTIIFLFYGFLRTFAGGFHARTSLGCTFLSIFSFALMVHISNIYLPLTVKLPMLVMSFIILLIYSPADNEEKPIVNKKHRKVLKILSCLIATGYILFSIINHNTYLANVLFVCTLFESIFVSPLPYKIFNRRWRNYGSYSNTTGQGG